MACCCCQHCQLATQKQVEGCTHTHFTSTSRIQPLMQLQTIHTRIATSCPTGTNQATNQMHPCTGCCSSSSSVSSSPGSHVWCSS
jgi:hypothetical protein